MPCGNWIDDLPAEFWPVVHVTALGKDAEREVIGK